MKKKIISNIYLKNGKAVSDPMAEIVFEIPAPELALKYANNHVDTLFVTDLSVEDVEHELNLDVDVKEIIMSNYKDSKCLTKGVTLRPYEAIVFKVK